MIPGLLKLTAAGQGEAPAEAINKPPGCVCVGGAVRTPAAALYLVGGVPPGLRADTEVELLGQWPCTFVRLLLHLSIFFFPRRAVPTYILPTDETGDC